MRTITLNGKTYVAGMEWRDMHTLKPRLRDYVDLAQEMGIKTKRPMGVYMLGQSKTNSVVGFTKDDKVKPTRKNNIYSLAATVAEDVEDGIYLAHFGDQDETWMLAVVDGMVSPATDLVLDRASLTSQVALARSLLPHMPFFVEDGLAMGYGDEQTWSLSEVLSKDKIKPVPIRRLGVSQGVNPALLAGGVIALVALGGGLWMMMHKPPKLTGPSQAEIEAQQRADYIAAIQGYTASVMPTSSHWVLQARQTIDREFPIKRYGWSFEGGDCNPQGCSIFFVADGEKQARSVEALMDSIHRPMDVVSMPEENTLKIGERLDPPSYVVLDEESINSLPDESDVFRAWRGFGDMAPLRLPGVVVEKPASAEDYAMTLPPPPGLPGVVKGVLAVSGYNPDDIPSVMRQLGSVPAMPTRLALSYGMAKTPRAWRMELTYLAKK
jgi:hypothetical protein